MSEIPKPVRARPVIPPDQQHEKQEKKPVTIEILAFELYEIRQFMRRSAAAKRRAGMLFMIWGGIFIAAGMLQGPVNTMGAGLTGEAGVILMIVGGGMRYSPENEV